MWKCPSCGHKNRFDTCAECGMDKSKAPKGSISASSFIVMVIFSLVIILGIFFAVDSFIDYKNKMNSYTPQAYESETDLPETEDSPDVAPVIEQTE